jgi:hypothetical protein
MAPRVEAGASVYQSICLSLRHDVFISARRPWKSKLRKGKPSPDPALPGKRRGTFPTSRGGPGLANAMSGGVPGFQAPHEVGRTGFSAAVLSELINTSGFITCATNAKKSPVLWDGETQGRYGTKPALERPSIERGIAPKLSALPTPAFPDSNVRVPITVRRRSVMQL